METSAAETLAVRRKGASLRTRIRFAAELARARARRLAAAAGLGRPATRYVWQRVEEHRRCWEAAARSIGAEFVALSDDVWEVRRDDRSTRIANDLIALDDPVTLQIAGDKELCYRLAAERGVRIPDFEVLDRADLVGGLRRVRLGTHPLVVKPAKGTSAGIGVTVGVRTRDELIRAVALA